MLELTLMLAGLALGLFLFQPCKNPCDNTGGGGSPSDSCSYFTPDPNVEDQDMSTLPAWTSTRADWVWKADGRLKLDERTFDNAIATFYATTASITDAGVVIVAETIVYRLDTDTGTTKLTFGGSDPDFAHFSIAALWAQGTYQTVLFNSEKFNSHPGPSDGDKLTIIIEDMLNGNFRACLFVNEALIASDTEPTTNWTFGEEAYGLLLAIGTSTLTADAGSFDDFKLQVRNR